MEYPVGTHVRAKVQLNSGSGEPGSLHILANAGDELVIRPSPVENAKMYDLYASHPEVTDDCFRVFYDEIEAI